MTGERVVFGLLWHSMNSDNLGVGALTLGHMTIIEDVCRDLGLEPHFVVIGWTDPKAFYFERPNIEVVQLRLSDYGKPGGLWAAFRRCDVVMDISGGDSFADIYGASRILKMIVAQNFALLAGRPLVISPQTIGPFDRPVIRRLALNTMRRAAAVASRDEPSTRFAREMGFQGDIIEASDVAFRMTYDPPPPRPADAPTRVGLNVSGLLVNGGYSQDNMFGLKVDYPKFARDMVGHFASLDGVEVHMVGHVLSESQPVEDDREAGLKLAGEFPNVKVAPVFASPIEAKSYIAGMDYFVGARMHACIAALTTGVPVMPTAYSRKFAGVFGTVGYAHCADCKSEDAATVMEKVRWGFENREALAEEAKAAADCGRARLKTYETWLAKFLRARYASALPNPELDAKPA